MKALVSFFLDFADCPIASLAIALALVAACFAVVVFAPGPMPL